MNLPLNTPDTDATTQHIMSRINPEIFKTLNQSQREAIHEAIKGNTPSKTHSIDLRGALPLFFTKFYFVFLMGRDRRTSTRQKEIDRKRAAKTASLFMFLYTAVCFTIPIILFALYLVKSMMGIDIFPDKHLYDFLK